jgi:cytochrome b pre-mRNA-processing protein 3
VQGLIDHFFQDVEERLRAVLQPGVLPPRSSSPDLSSNAEDGSHYPPSSFYTTPTPLAPKSTFPSTKAYQEAVKLQKRSRAPEKLIIRQMKILKEQWAGMGMSLDLGLVRGDAELAAAVWRNLLGARGANGIGLGQESNGSGYRRAVNLVGGLVEDVRKMDVDKEELKDDNSGVHDFAPSENDRYIGYPELMVTLVSYIRREILRLERLDDSVITGPRRVGREGEGLEDLRWGDIQSNVRR